MSAYDVFGVILIGAITTSVVCVLIAAGCVIWDAPIGDWIPKTMFISACAALVGGVGMSLTDY